MNTHGLEIGGTYVTEWDARPYRIIGVDDIEVFYDCWHPHDNSWTFSGNFKKKCYFDRTSNSLFAEKSTRQDILPLSDEEQKAFRPDLVMRIGRTKELSWNRMDFQSHADFLSKFSTSFNPEFRNQKIDTNEIVILPYGPKGGLKKGVLLSADNEKYFSTAELIWKAKSIQESINPEESNGIGLYRIGFEKGLPSYYIGEYLDKAGLIKE